MPKAKIQSIELRKNYDYLNFIKKNHLMIDVQPTSILKKIKGKKFVFDPIEDVVLMSKQRNQLTQPQSIFVHPQSKKRYDIIANTKSQQKKQSQQNIPYEKVLEIMQQRNQQIAEMLMHQRQSMSDLVYTGGGYKKIKSLQHCKQHNKKTQNNFHSASNVKSELRCHSNKYMPQPLLKFPQLVQRKVHYIMKTLDQPPIQKNSIQIAAQNLQNRTSIMQRGQSDKQQKNPIENAQKRTQKHNQKIPTKLLRAQQQKNKQVLAAYYKNNVVHLNEQNKSLPEKFANKNKKVNKKSQKSKKSVIQFKLNFNYRTKKNQPIQNYEEQFRDFEERHRQCQHPIKSADQVENNFQDKHNFNKVSERFNVKIIQDQRQRFNIKINQDLGPFGDEQPFSEAQDQIGELNQLLKQKQQEKNQITQQLFSEQEEGQRQNVETVSPTVLKKTKSKLQLNKKKSIISINDKQHAQQTVYQGKIRIYRQFLFQMNLAYRKFDTLLLKEDYNYMKSQSKYRYWIGRGNNSNLLHSLMKRRFWWTIQQDYKKANFVWSQLKINQYYQYQTKSYYQKLQDKLQQQKQQQGLSLPQIPSPTKVKKKQNKSPIKVTGVFKPPLPNGYNKIFTKVDKFYYEQFLKNADQKRFYQYSNRLKSFPTNFLEERKQDHSQNRMHNHFEFNYFIGNKKALFYNLKQYYQLLGKDVFTIIPLTYHIKTGINDPEYQSFIKEYKQIKLTGKSSYSLDPSSKKPLKNIWIVKPGQISNRGNGITVIDEVYEFNAILKKKQKHPNGHLKTYIVQKYIQRPMLYNRRKFDIRHYLLITRLHGRMRAYWFGQGYIRTSCFEYNLQEIGDEYTHLTNDAIQKNSTNYGKFQQGNKLSYNQFQRYLDSTFPQKKYSFVESIYPKMRSIALDAVKATYMKLDPSKYEDNFQLLGLDFMIDMNFNVWLIEANTNPCLEISSTLLSRIIPTVVEHSLRLTLDVIFPPPAHYPNSQKYLAPDNVLERLQYQLIFDEGRDSKEIQQLYENAKQLQIQDIDQQDQTYQNEGKQLDIGNEL